MSVRAKFKVVAITQTYYNASQRQIVLAPEYDTAIPEDERFSKYTPSGRLEMTVDNPRVIEQLELGQQYYIDITPAN